MDKLLEDIKMLVREFLGNVERHNEVAEPENHIQIDDVLQEYLSESIGDL